MNRLVYLFELDSSIKTQKQADEGQQALYNEIVNNGNYVAISFNQLADSYALAAIIGNEKAYNNFMQLMTHGAVRISLYGKYTTASQYIQEALKRNMTADNGFIFSILPVRTEDKDMMLKLEESLKYSSLSWLDDMIGKATDAAEIERLKYIKRYLKMILDVSVSETSSNPPKTGEMRKLCTFIEIIENTVKQLTFHDEDIVQNISCAVSILKRTKGRLENTPNTNLNERSSWTKELLKKKSDIKTRLALKLVNLAYNYTIEDSINDVSKHYDDSNFDETFKKDLKSRIEKGSIPSENELNNDLTDIINIQCCEKDWKTASRVFGYNKKRSVITGVYECGYTEERKKWISTVIKRIVISAFQTLIYCILFVLIQIGLGNVQENTESVLSALGNVIVLNILSVTVFGIFGSVVMWLTKIPDIFDSVKNLTLCLGDVLIILCGKYNSFKLRSKTDE